MIGWRTSTTMARFMRAFVLAPLTVVLFGCTTTTSVSSRDESPTKRNPAIRPPLTLDGVLASSETLGTLPEGWWADGTSDFRDRHDGLGIALQYKSETAWATFYLYDFGEKDIVGRGEDARIEAVAKQALREILSAYRNVKPGALVVVPLCGGAASEFRRRSMTAAMHARRISINRACRDSSSRLGSRSFRRGQRQSWRTSTRSSRAAAGRCSSSSGRGRGGRTASCSRSRHL